MYFLAFFIDIIINLIFTIVANYKHFQLIINNNKFIEYENWKTNTPRYRA